MKVFFFGEHQPCHYPFQTNLQFDFCLFCFERFSILASHRTFSKGWLKQTVERFLLSIKMKHQNFKEKPFTLSTWWNNLIWLKNHNWKINFLSWLMWFSKLFLNFPYHQNILELYQIQNCIQNISILNVVQGIPHAYHLFQADVDRPCFQQKQSQQFFHNVSPMNIFREIAHTYTHTPELLLVQAEQAKQEAVRKLCFVRSACVVRRFGGGGARQGSMSASESWTQASLSSYSSSRFFTDSRPCFGLPLPLLLLLMLPSSSCCCYIQPKRLRL